jgi:hypothetical protein
MGADGALALVAALPAGALPAAWPQDATVLRLRCTAAPRPDLDQLGPAPALARMARRGARLQGVLAPAPDASALRDGPVLVRLEVGGTTAIRAVSALADDGRPGLALGAPDGFALRLRPTRRGWRVRLELGDASLPGQGDVALRMRLGTVDAAGTAR